MITAHLPSGYVLGRAAGWSGPVMVAAIIGAAWPDLDLFFFYFVDNRAFHHHYYWVHAPAFALLISLAMLAVTRWRWQAAFPVVLAFASGWVLHLLLDSIAGGIMWFWPFSTELFLLFPVPATQSHWVLSFILHWTFLAELVVWAITIILLLRSRRT